MRRQIILLIVGFLTLAAVRHLPAQEKGEGRRLYLAYCAACHGESGRGDGPASKALPAKPANHTDAAFMNQLSDKYLFEIITRGGKALGKSPVMPAWGNLKGSQVREIIDYIRTLASPPPKTKRSEAK